VQENKETEDTIADYKNDDGKIEKLIRRKNLKFIYFPFRIFYAIYNVLDLL